VGGGIGGGGNWGRRRSPSGRFSGRMFFRYGPPTGGTKGARRRTKKAGRNFPELDQKKKGEPRAGGGSREERNFKPKEARRSNREHLSEPGGEKKKRTQTGESTY